MIKTKKMEQLISDSKNEYISFFKSQEVKFNEYLKKTNYASLHINDIKVKGYLHEVSIVEIVTDEDLKKIIAGSGFYIILSDYGYAKNTCRLELLLKERKVKAIYRGQCSKVRERIMSHLFIDKYNDTHEDNKFTVCMQLEKGKQGINRENNLYCHYKFYIIQHKMYNSNQWQREIMEEQFDEIYGRPFASMK